MVHPFIYGRVAMNMLRHCENWWVLPLAKIGIMDLAHGEILRFRNGMQFQIKDLVAAEILDEVLFCNEYPFKPTKRSMTVLDIGANIGAFTIYAASMDPLISVISVEPSVETFKSLLANIHLNGLETRVTCLNLAVWDKTCEKTLWNPGVAGLRSFFQITPADKSETVRCTTIEHIFKEQGIEYCDYLKIDCQGAEFEILENCPDNIFSKINRIVVEFHELRKGFSQNNLVIVLKKHGFKVAVRLNPRFKHVGKIDAIRCDQL